jgi:hypothetical protein
MNKLKEKVQDKARERASTAAPYARRLLEDAELRDSLKSAYSTAREVYQELWGPKGLMVAGTRLAADKDLQRKVQELVDDLRQARTKLTVSAPPLKASKRSLLLTGAGIALVAVALKRLASGNSK